MPGISASQLRKRAERLQDKAADLEARYFGYHELHKDRTRKKRDALISRAKKLQAEACKLAKAGEGGRYKIGEETNVKGSLRRIRRTESDAKEVIGKLKRLAVSR